jgi:hypothetical protein
MLDDHFYSEAILHEIGGKFSGNHTSKVLSYFDFIEELHDFEFMKSHISKKSTANQTILFQFKNREKIITVLKWFCTKFENDKEFIAQFLLQVDSNGDSFLTNGLEKYRFESCFDKIFKFLLQNFDKPFVQDFLLIENNANQNCLNVIGDKNRGNVIGYLGCLFKGFQNDQIFFAKLINDKLKENGKVKKWMNDRFKINE